MITPQQIIVPKRRELWKPAPVRCYTQNDVMREERWRATVPPSVVGATANHPSAANALDPLTIVTSRPWAIAFSATHGIAESGGAGTGVSQWDDQTGLARHSTQGTLVSRPAISASDAAFSGLPSVTGDGSNDWMSVAWDPPTVGTTPIVFFFIFRQITWTTGDYIFAGGNQTLSLIQSGTTPALVGANNTVGLSNTGAAVGSVVRGRMYFSNSTNDYIKLGSTIQTGTSLGNTGIAAFHLFARNTGSGPGNVSFFWFGATVGGDWTTQEKNDMDAWTTAICPAAGV